jgi:4a-hydroxytetrahydrobiopterin dehydratase
MSSAVWVEKDQQLQATFQFAHFRQAFAFMTEVAFLAEEMNHHPNWSNVYNRVHIALSTHDAGNVVTELDHRLAAGIDAIYQRY